MSPLKTAGSESLGSTEDPCLTPTSGSKKLFPPMRIVPKPLVENKENTDPLLEGNPVREESLKPIDPDVSMNSDGFEVCDDIKLDDSSSESHDESGCESSPFMKSLICNKLMFSMDKQTSLKLMSSEEGSSPALSVPSSRAIRGNAMCNGASPICQPMGKFRRSISMVEKPVFSQDFFLTSSDLMDLSDSASPIAKGSFKRPVPPSHDDNTANSKKYKCSKENFPKLVSSKSTSSLLSSPTIARIMHACSLSERPNLTADRSSQLSLPTINGSNKNLDLNNIDSHVMAMLLNGAFDQKVASYRIIDARYAYEYDGGHIRGAENYGLWDEERFFQEFFPKHLEPKKLTFNQDEKTLESANTTPDGRKTIIIFHCEFSSARGPGLLRTLRKKDREVNQDTYPALHYPECYLLHEGYKAFFSNYPTLCEPQSYVPMNDPSFVSEERKFHKKSRSWAAGGAGTIARTGSSSRLLKL